MHGIGLSESAAPAFGLRFFGRTVVTSFNVSWFVYLLAFYVAEGISHESAIQHPDVVWWIQLSSLVGPFVITLVILLLSRFFKSGRARTFFGVGMIPTLTVIVSTYEHVKPYASKTEERYCKTDPIRSSPPPHSPAATAPPHPVETPPTPARRFLHGANGPVVGLETLRCAVTVYNTARTLLGFNIRLESDEIVAGTGTNPQGLGSSSYLCLGSPGSNNVSRQLWAEDLPMDQAILPRFVVGGKLEIQNGTTFTADDATDYAVLLKIHHAGSVFFICAGIDEEGTVASADWLLANWTQLYRRVKGNDFCMILKIDKTIFRQVTAAAEVGDLLVKTPGEKYFNVKAK